MMKSISEKDGERTVSGIRWVRALLAAVAVHVAGIVVPVVAIVAYSAATAGASVEGFAGPLFSWVLPVLTLPAAVWVARGGTAKAAVPNGLLVGGLVAGALGLLFYWPTDPRSVTIFALIIAAGLVGGAISTRR